MQATVNANKPQSDFLALDCKFKAFVGGFGSGKTYAGAMSQAIHYLEHPRVNQGYFAPTYPQIRDIFYPTIEEVAHSFGLRVDIKESNKEVHWFNGRKYIGTTICRSMDQPNNIIGFKIGRAMVDELDVLPLDKAQNSWRKIIARMRWADVQNGIDVTTTPEGFKFVYKQFVEHVQNKGESGKYGIIHASTYENEANLPEDYIDSLIETYPDELIEAYIKGRFVNLTAGSVYRNYDRKVNNSSETIDKGEPLFIGQDFNVGQMASCVFVKRSNGYHCVDELKGLLDTPKMLEVVAERYAGHKVIFYPDASGQNRSTKGAARSDLDLIKLAGNQVKVNYSNPFVKDRVLAVNTAFNKKLVWVNADNCPETVKCLEQQAYDKNGEPDKKSGTDHQVDGFGYFVAHELPVVKPTVKVHHIAGGY